MIKEYHRPDNLEQALTLLARPSLLTLPLAGGTVLNRTQPDDCAVVDLQALGLNQIQAEDNLLRIGATVTLQDLYIHNPLFPALKESIRLECTHNLRQMGTVAGTLVVCDGRSHFAAAMLALDVGLVLQPGGKEVLLGDFLPLRPAFLKGKLITEVIVKLPQKLAYHTVGRTPADQPLVCAAAAKWDSSRVRVVLGGYGSAPLMIVDGRGMDGAVVAARNAYSGAVDDRASAEYRSDVAGVLVERCLADLEGES